MYLRPAAVNGLGRCFSAFPESRWTETFNRVLPEREPSRKALGFAFIFHVSAGNEEKTSTGDKDSKSACLET